MNFSVTKSVLRRLFGLWLCAFALCAWSATVEITDALGRKVKVKTPVQRVALNFNFEEFTAVDNWAKVVGIARAVGGLAPSDLQPLRGS